MRSCIKYSFMNFLFIILVSFFMCIPTICFSAPVEYYGDGGTSSGGGGGRGTNSFYGYMGYRITLVDINGNKVPGTRSVDFIYYGSSTNMKLKEGYQNNLLYPNYKYRFGSNDASEYIEIGSSFIPFKNGVYDLVAHENFINQFFIDFSNFDNRVFTNPTNSSEKIDFIALFLYYSNFLKDNYVKNFTDLLAMIPQLKEYFLSIELLVGGGDYGTLEKYGTGAEMIEYMNTSAGTKYRDNMAVEKLVFACGLFTTPNFKEKYKNFNAFGSSDHYFYTYDDCVRDVLAGYPDNKYLWTGNACVKNDTPWAYGINGLECGGVNQYGTGTQIDNLKTFLDRKDNYAAGVAMISLNMEKTGTKVESFLNLCYDNKVSFNGNFSDSVKNNSLFTTNIFADAEQKLYCYDTVTFDYSSIVNVFGKDKFLNTEFNTDDLKISAQVTRRCYSDDSNALSASLIEKQVKNDYNYSINVSVYGKKYEFKPQVGSGGVEPFIGNGLNYVYKFDFKTDSISVGYSSGVSTGNGTGYIDFSNYKNMFGSSNNFLGQILNYDSSECSGPRKMTNCMGIYQLNFNDRSKNGKCEFSYNLIKTGASVDEINFRVISLENPFPGRDGTSRMPAKNWFYNDNYVFDYIENNRGIKSVLRHNADVSPEAMYSQLKPMYSITLTPSTMMKIRKYNKLYSYYSMYEIDSNYKTKVEEMRKADRFADKLKCDSSGRQCFSSFLRNSSFIPQDDVSLSGTCMLAKNSNDYNYIRQVLSGYSTYPYLSYDKLYNYIFNNGEKVNVNSYDLNYNNRIDIVDYFILRQSIADEIAHTGSNTTYYTCANKTYFSGGPIDIGEGDD